MATPGGTALRAQRMTVALTAALLLMAAPALSHALDTAPATAPQSASAPQTPPQAAPDPDTTAPPEALPAPDGWLQSQAVQRRLAAGNVVTRAEFDEHQARASVDAAIRIHAPPALIWPLITECRHAAVLIPGLRHCKVLQSAPDGSWAVIEHDIRYSALLPMVHSVFRAEFQPPFRMDFHRVRGNLKSEVGSWTLTPSADGSQTTVEYRVSMQPGFWVPHAFVRHSLRKQLPAALLAVRAHAEHSEQQALAGQPLSASEPRPQ